MTALAPLQLDPAFPTLSAALDPHVAGKALASAIGQSGNPVEIGECLVERARLKQGRKALIGYRLRGQDQSGHPFDQRLMLTLFPGGEAGRLPAITGIANGSILDVDALSGRAWLFPADRKVRHIAALLGEHPDPEVIHYVPEQGCTVRARLGDGRVLYGKCRADGRGATAARLGHCGMAKPSGVRLAPVISFDEERNILWQEEVAGVPLDPADVLRQPGLWAPRIAGAIRAFHDLPAPAGLKQLTPASLAANLTQRAERSGAAMPDLAARLYGTLRQLLAVARRESAPALAHCDLHAANLLWDGNSFALIDLDTASLAPRALDYGSLAAALTDKAIANGAPDEAIGAMLAALRQAAAAELGDPENFDSFTAASLLGERLYRSGTRLKNPDPLHRERLLDAAERLVARHV